MIFFSAIKRVCSRTSSQNVSTHLTFHCGGMKQIKAARLYHATRKKSITDFLKQPTNDVSSRFHQGFSTLNPSPSDISHNNNKHDDLFCCACSEAAKIILYSVLDEPETCCFLKRRILNIFIYQAIWSNTFCIRYGSIQTKN